MIESLMSLGMLRCFVTGEHRHKPVGHADRVYHLMFGISGMHIGALLKNNLGRSSMKFSNFQLTHFTAIHSIGPFHNRIASNIELMCSPNPISSSGLKSDTVFAMLDSGCSFRYTIKPETTLANVGFYLSAPSKVFPFGTAIRSLPLWSEQFGKLGRRKGPLSLFAKNNILCHRNSPHMGDILTTHIGACIHVGNEPHDRYRLICIGRKGWRNR